MVEEQTQTSRADTYIRPANECIKGKPSKKGNFYRQPSKEAVSLFPSNSFKVFQISRQIGKI